MVFWAFGTWLFFYNLVAFAITRVFWNKQWRGAPWLPSTLSAVQVFLTRLLPMCAIFFVPMSGMLSSRTYPLELVLLCFLVFFPLSTWCSRYWQRRRAVLAGSEIVTTSLRERLRHVRLSPVHLFIFIFIGSTLLPGGAPPVTGYMILFAVGYVAWDAWRRKKAAPAGMIEMEEVPLLSEIERVCVGFGRKVRQVFVAQETPAHSYSPIRLFTLDNPYTERTPRLIVPTQNLKELNPSTYTAALALHFAKEPTARFSDNKVVNPVSPGVLMIVVFVGSIAIFLISGYAARSAPPPFPVFFLMPFMAVLVVMGVRLYFASTGVRAHGAAFKIWQEAEQREHRMLQDYVNAIAEHHAFHHRINDPGLVRHQLALDSSLRKFIAESSIAPPEEVLESATAHVAEWQAHRAGEGVGVGVALLSTR